MTTPDAEAVASCEHAVIQTWRTEDGVVRLWACADCRLRFHPATLARRSELAAAINLFIGSYAALLHRERHRDIECEDGPDEWIARANGAWQHAQDEARAAIEGWAVSCRHPRVEGGGGA